MGLANTARRDKSRARGEPTWAVAHMFPSQGAWTEEEFLRNIDERGYELVNGYVERLPVPSELHQLIAGFLYRSLFAFVEAQRLGIVIFMGLRVRIAEKQIREPDLVFMSHAHAAKRDNQVWQGADLVMEIVSPDDPSRDWDVKRREYAKAGIAEYWIVDPQKKSITVLQLAKGRYKVHGEFKRGEHATSALLSGFTVNVSQALKPV